MPKHITEADLALLAFAREIQRKAYVPYSNFRVGAAIFAGGEIFQGVNVENAAYGSTICAERSAALAAVTAGHTDFDAVAVIGDSEAPPGQTVANSDRRWHTRTGDGCPPAP